MKNKRYLFNAYLLITLFLSVLSLNAQDQDLEFKVLDANRDAIAGAKITLPGNPEVSFLTDEEGKVMLGLAPGQLIRVSYKNRQKTLLLNASETTVLLDENDQGVSLGFNYEREKTGLSSAVDVVYAEELNNSSALNPEESLYGRLAGLSVMQNGGTPLDRNPDMLIRGVGSLSARKIITVVDGVKRDISSLVNEEIESITLLKDAAALAMYGIEGANGVLSVKTKRGEYEEFKVGVSIDQSTNSAFRLPEMLNGYEYARAVNEASALDGNPYIYSQWDLEDFKSGAAPELYPNVDWFNEALRERGSGSSVGLNFSGGGQSARYFVLLNYQSENGLFKNTDIDDRYNSQLNYDRFNFRTNVDVNLTSSTLLKVDIAGRISNQTEPDSRVSNIMPALYTVPSGAFPVRSINDVWGGTDYYDNNPVAMITATGEYKLHQTELNTRASLIQDLGAWAKGLSAELTVAYDNEPSFYERKRTDFVFQDVKVIREQETGTIVDTSINLLGTETDFSFDHGLGWQKRQSAAWAKLNYDRNYSKGQFSSSILYNMDKRIYTGQNNTYLKQQVAAFAGYAYLNKYFIDFTLAYSGSSGLREGERFGLFPAISGAWVIANEPISSKSPLSFLKVRASWGLNGDAAVGTNLFDQKFNSGGNYLFTVNQTSQKGLSEGKLATENPSFEKAQKANLGMELAFFHKIDFNADLFYEKRTDIFIDSDAVTSGVLGVGTASMNEGIVINRGAEMSLLFHDQAGPFKYRLGGNFAYAKNEIVEMNEVYRPYDYLNRTGSSVGQQFGLESDGFFDNEEEIANSPQQVFSNVRPGDVKYVDQNGDNIISAYDEVAIGYSNLNPEIYYSTSLGLEYAGFGVDVLMQGIANQTLYLTTRSIFKPLVNQNSISTAYADRWTPETAASASLPRLTLLENDNNYRKNDIWLTSADYLKLRFVDLYYKFPDRILDKMSMASMKLYLRGTNLFSIDQINVLDPEQTGVSYPTLKSYHVGINVEF